MITLFLVTAATRTRVHEGVVTVYSYNEHPPSGVVVEGGRGSVHTLVLRWTQRKVNSSTIASSYPGR